jgi:hypothetical protein
MAYLIVAVKPAENLKLSAARESRIAYDGARYPSPDRDRHTADSSLDRLAMAIERLAAALEAFGARGQGLGESRPSGYPVQLSEIGLVDEKAMALSLGLSKRTLADYRRRGRLGGCWIRNGRHIRWRVAQTLSAWERGIA